MSKPEAPESADAPLLPDYLLFLLASVSAAASAEFHAVVREHGLRVPEWRVLASLQSGEGRMVTRLAVLTQMEQSRLTRVLDQMAGRGLIERRSDPRDRRRVRIHLTREGAALADRMVTLARDHEARLIARLPGGMGTDLKRLLRRAYTELDATGGAGAVAPDADLPSEAPST